MFGRVAAGGGTFKVFSTRPGSIGRQVTSECPSDDAEHSTEPLEVFFDVRLPDDPKVDLERVI
jgi:hypothetical protein